MTTLFANWNKVLAGMVTMTFCLAVLGVIFLPSLGHPIDDTARLFVFTAANSIIIAVGLGGNSIARTLGVRE